MDQERIVTLEHWAAERIESAAATEAAHRAHEQGGRLRRAGRFGSAFPGPAALAAAAGAQLVETDIPRALPWFIDGRTIYVAHGERRLVGLRALRALAALLVLRAGPPDDGLEWLLTAELAAPRAVLLEGGTEACALMQRNAPPWLVAAHGRAVGAQTVGWVEKSTEGTLRVKFT